MNDDDFRKMTSVNDQNFLNLSTYTGAITNAYNLKSGNKDELVIMDSVYTIRSIKSLEKVLKERVGDYVKNSCVKHCVLAVAYKSNRWLGVYLERQINDKIKMTVIDPIDNKADKRKDFLMNLVKSYGVQMAVENGYLKLNKGLDVNDSMLYIVNSFRHLLDYEFKFDLEGMAKQRVNIERRRIDFEPANDDMLPLTEEYDSLSLNEMVKVIPSEDHLAYIFGIKDANSAVYTIFKNIYNGSTYETVYNKLKFGQLKSLLKNDILRNDSTSSLRKPIKCNPVSIRAIDLVEDIATTLDQHLGQIWEDQNNEDLDLNQINTGHPVSNYGLFSCLFRTFSLELNLKPLTLDKIDNWKKTFYCIKNMVETERLQPIMANFINILDNIISLVKLNLPTNVIMQYQKNVSYYTKLVVANNGFVHQVIDVPKEFRYAELKEYYMSREIPNSKIYTWKGIDADGNNKNHCGNIIKISHNATIKSIHDQRQVDSRFCYQSRVSYDDKKTVDGVETCLKNLTRKAGLDLINDIDDLQEETIDMAYTKFAQYLDTLEYASDNTNKLANNPLDFILRFTLSYFCEALGTIISDFPSDSPDGIRAISQLRFIQIAVARYLYIEEEDIQNHLIQLLCEDKESLAGCAPLFRKVFNLIGNIYTEADSDRQQEMRKIFFPNNTFFLSPFFGPSDTQAVIGGTAPPLLFQALLEVQQAFLRFKKEHSLEEMHLVINYGRGNGYCRGMAFMMPNFAMTNQGFSYSVINSSTMKEAAYMNSVQLGILDDLNLVETTLEEFKTNFIDVLKGGQPSHEKFWDIQNGTLVHNYDRIVRNPNSMMTELIKKETMTPVGTRGVCGREFKTVKYGTLRAISKGFARVTSGLPAFMGYPIEWSTNSEGIERYLKTTYGSASFISEMLGYLLVDFDRARA